LTVEIALTEDLEFRGFAVVAVVDRDIAEHAAEVGVGSGGKH
jgi:hypothetical protein